jgi:hypothetical protein
MEGGSFQPGAPAPLFTIELPVALTGYPYAASRDGERFIVARPASGEAPAPFSVVLNWPGLIRK